MTSREYSQGETAPEFRCIHCGQRYTPGERRPRAPWAIREDGTFEFYDASEECSSCFEDRATAARQEVHA